MSNVVAPLSIKIYGIDNDVKREVTRSIIPWGILERALDLQDEFENVKFDEQGKPIGVNREQVQMLTDFVVFMFDDAVTADELKRGADLADMFALYKQIFRMVSQIMPKNPTTALTSQQNLRKVRQGNKKRQ